MAEKILGVTDKQQIISLIVATKAAVSWKC